MVYLIRYAERLQFIFQTGTSVVYSKYAGTEVEFNGTRHLLLKEDDIVGILETDDIKDLKPLNDRVLIKVGLRLDTLCSSFCVFLNVLTLHS